MREEGDGRRGRERTRAGGRKRETTRMRESEREGQRKTASERGERARERVCVLFTVCMCVAVCVYVRSIYIHILYV